MPTTLKQLCSTGLQKGALAAMAPNTCSVEVQVHIAIVPAHRSVRELLMIRFLANDEKAAMMPSAISAPTSALSRQGRFKFHRKLIGARESTTSVVIEIPHPT